MNQNTVPSRSFPAVSPRAAVLIPVLVALALRLIYVFTFRDSPAFTQPIMDEAIHDGWARGGMQFMYDGVPYFRAPLYMWFLQLNYVVNDGYLWVRIIQALLSALTVGFVADLGRRLGGPLAGLVGGLLLAFCWPVIYFAGELVIVTLFTTLLVAALWCLVVAGERRSLAVALVGAALIGVASMARPTSLVFLPGLAWLGLRTWRDWLHAPRARLLAVAGMLGLALLPGLALTARNQVVGGDAVFIASQGGLNFYIGNNPQSDGRTAVVPGTSGTWSGGYLQAIEMAERAEGRDLSPSEISDHYFRKGLGFWAEDPGGALRLYGHKLRLLLGAPERSNNKNPHFWRDQNPLLRLPVFSSWALVFALGVVGMFLVRRRREAVPVNLFVLLYALGLLLFFINERFRTPETIALAAFAGVPFAHLVQAWKVDRPRAGAILVSVVAVLSLSSLDRVGFHGDNVEADAFSQYSLANMHLRTGDADEAVEGYVRALDSARRFRLAGFGEVEKMARDHLVTALLRTGREEEAARQVEHFVATWPGDWRSELLQGRLELYRFSHYKAKAHFDAALEMNPGAVEALVGVGRVLTHNGDLDGAERILRKAIEMGGDREGAWGALAMVALRRDDDTARPWRYAERALELDPEDAVAHHVMANYWGKQAEVPHMLYHYQVSLRREPNNRIISRVLRRAHTSIEELLANKSLVPPPPLR